MNLKFLFKYGLLFLVMLSSGLAWSANPPQSKPQSPISVSILPEQTPLAGQSVSFVVQATTKIDTQYFVVRIQTPPGTEFLQGTQEWNGALTRGETKILRFICILPDRPNLTVAAYAALQSTTGAHFAARDVFRIGASKSKQQSSVFKNSQSNGRTLAEYPVD